MDFSRLRQGEIIAGIGGIALFVFLFFDWYGVGDAGFSGWDSLQGDVTGFIVAAAAVSGVALAALAAGGRRLNVPAPRGGITAVLAYLAVGIILWRIVASGEADLEFGIFLGLIAAAAIAVGATIVLREDGYEPLVGYTPAGAASSAAEAPTREAPAKPSVRRTAARKKKPAARKKKAEARSRS